MTLATLIVQVEANTAKLVTGVEATNKSLNSVVDVAGKVGTAMATAFTVTAIIGAGKQIIDFAGNVTDLSQRLGISTSGIQKFQLAFEKSGVSIETVGKSAAFLANALVSGDKGAANALDKLGLSATELKSLSMEDMFTKVADAVGGVGNKAEQIYASKTLFGKGGVDLLAGLDGKLKETTDSFEAMGLIIDKKTLTAADDFGDQLGLMGKQLLGIVATIVGPFLPALSAIGNILSWVGRTVIGPVFNVAIKSAMTLLGLFWEGLSALLSKIVGFGASLPIVGGQFKALAQTLADSSADTTKYLDGLWKSAGSVAEKADVAAPKLLGLGGSTDGLGKSVKAVKEEVDKLLPSQNTWQLGIGQLVERVPELSGHMREMRQVFEDLDTWVEPLASHTLDLGKNIGVLPNVTPGATQALKDARVEAASLGDTIKGNLSSALAGIPGTLVSAFTGGGGIVGALKAIAVQVAEAIIKPMIASFIAAAAQAAGIKVALNGVTTAAAGTSTALTGIGTSGAAGGAAAAGGMSAATAATLGFGAAAVYAIYLFRQSRSEAANMQAQFDDLSATVLKYASAEQVAAAHGDQMALAISVISDAFVATGHTAQEAGEAFRAVLNARTEGPEALAAAIQTLLVPVLQTVKDNLDAIAKAQEIATGKFNDFAGVVADVGIGIPDFLQPMIDDLLAAPGLTDELKASITGLRDSASPDFAKMEALAKSYGVQITELGPKFQQAHVTADAQKWITDYTNLMAAGADYNGVLGGMADEASAVVQESMKFGTTIPENMKPMLEAMIKNGQLLDENKNKITDISDLKFGAAVKTDVDKMKDAIELLIQAIEKIPGKIGEIAHASIPPVHVPVVFDVDHSPITPVIESSRGARSAFSFGAGGGSVSLARIVGSGRATGGGGSDGSAAMAKEMREFRRDLTRAVSVAVTAAITLAPRRAA